MNHDYSVDRDNLVGTKREEINVCVCTEGSKVVEYHIDPSQRVVVL